MLRVMLMDAPSFGAHHVLRTGSWNSIRSILATLEMVHERVGSLGGIPFKLKCQQENIRDGEGRDRLVTVAHLEVVGTLTEMIALAEGHAQRRISLGRNQAVLAQPKPIEDELDEMDHDFTVEFRPDLPDDDEIVEADIVDQGPDMGSYMLQDLPDDDFIDPVDDSAPAPEDEPQCSPHLPNVPDFDL
jgi:hypothetical protein